MFDDRSHEVYPVVGEVKQHQIWAERARRIHRGPADRARPELGEDDVGPHPERRDRPEVLRPRGRAQDRTHQAGRQENSIINACRSLTPGPGSVAPSIPTLPNMAHNNRQARVDPTNWAMM